MASKKPNENLFKNNYDFEMDYSLLRSKIILRFRTISKFCAYIGMPKQQFSAKLTGNIRFTYKDILNLCEVLDIDQNEIGAYFFSFKRLT